jgi:drug/metabolite transporter (DMT)-like permease
MSALRRIDQAAGASPRSRFSPEAAGLATGLTAAVIWGSYLAMARAGVSSGLAASDIAFIRYSVAGIIMLPWLLTHGPRNLAGVGWGRALVLALLAGPLFVLVGAGGYRFAPLAHGAVLQPAALTCSAMLASTVVFGERLTFSRVLGLAMITVGLTITAGPGLFHGSTITPLGDVMFASAGMMWAAFTILSRRWHINPLAATAVVSVPSAFLYVPGYLVMADTGRLLAAPLHELLSQIIVQGVLSGVVAVLAFSRSVQLLGASRASVFPALVPVSATLLGIPIVGEIPTALQGAGLAIVNLGLIVANQMGAHLMRKVSAFVRESFHKLGISRRTNADCAGR